jgi:hypothetical protein
VISQEEAERFKRGLQKIAGAQSGVWGRIAHEALLGRGEFAPEEENVGAKTYESRTISPPPERLRHDLSVCEANLMAHPEYDAFKGTPKTFVCVCGCRFEHIEDEAEGNRWLLVE